MQQSDHCPGPGKLAVVGIGPGHRLDRTFRCEQTILNSDVVVGYPRYLEHIKDLLPGKEVYSSAMTKEVERCHLAVDKALAGYWVALISSGDAGVYGMAGLALEILGQKNEFLPVEIVPGVTAGLALGAKLGAPLMLDFACISLSDLLVDWSVIEKRLHAVAQADMTTILYNPKSKKRVWQIQKAREIFLSYRSPKNLVSIGTDLTLDEEKVIITDLEHMLEHEINMRSAIIIASSETRKIGPWLVTPRGYSLN